MTDSSQHSGHGVYVHASVTLPALLAVVLCFVVYPRYAAVAALAAFVGGTIAAACARRHPPISPLAKGGMQGGWRLPWNKQQSWADVLAFAAGAVLLCLVALYLCSCPLFRKISGSPEWPYVRTLSVLAAVAGAILHSLEGPGPQALRVPLGVGGVVWLLAEFLSFATWKLPADTHVQPEVLPRALAVNVAFGAGVLLLRFADLPATVLGALIGTLVYFLAGWQGYLMLAVFVVAGSVLSRLGWEQKAKLGVAEARHGKRGIANVAANLLVPALCCLAYPPSAGHPLFLMAFAGAVAAAFADTASAEIGVLSKQQPVLITSRKPVPHGTNGGVSALGFVAALGACVLLAGVAWADGFFALILKHHVAVVGQSARLSSSWKTMSAAAAILVAAGMFGTVADSFLGATVEDRYTGVGKGAVNFACTLTGAIVAGAATAAWLR